MHNVPQLFPRVGFASEVPSSGQTLELLQIFALWPGFAVCLVLVLAVAGDGAEASRCEICLDTCVKFWARFSLQACVKQTQLRLGVHQMDDSGILRTKNWLVAKNWLLLRNGLDKTAAALSILT